MNFSWSTASNRAATLAVLLAFFIWLYVMWDLGPAYGSRWWSALRLPFFVLGLYVYYLVLFRLLAISRRLTRFVLSSTWLLAGTIVSYWVAYGLVIAFTYLGYVFPRLTYIPIGLQMFDNAIHVLWVSFLVGIACFFVNSYKKQSEVAA